MNKGPRKTKLKGWMSQDLRTVQPIHKLIFLSGEEEKNN